MGKEQKRGTLLLHEDSWTATEKVIGRLASEKWRKRDRASNKGCFPTP